MSPVVLAWIISIGGALAFLVAGYLIGRNRAPALAHAPLQSSGFAPPPTPPPMGLPPTAAAPVARPAEPSPAPRTARPKTVDASYLEGRLTRCLRGLDPERALSQLVLCDETGLPIAAADPVAIEGGVNEDPESLSALGAEALSLMGRVDDVLAASRAVTVDLPEGRRLQVRPIPGTEVPIFLVSIGRSTVSDERFAPFAAEVRELIDASPDLGA